MSFACDPWALLGLAVATTALGGGAFEHCSTARTRDPEASPWR